MKRKSKTLGFFKTEIKNRKVFKNYFVLYIIRKWWDELSKREYENTMNSKISGASRQN